MDAVAGGHIQREERFRGYVLLHPGSKRRNDPGLRRGVGDVYEKERRFGTERREVVHLSSEEPIDSGKEQSHEL